MKVLNIGFPVSLLTAERKLKIWEISSYGNIKIFDGLVITLFFKHITLHVVTL